MSGAADAAGRRGRKRRRGIVRIRHTAMMTPSMFLFLFRFVWSLNSKLHFSTIAIYTRMFSFLFVVLMRSLWNDFRKDL